MKRSGILFFCVLMGMFCFSGCGHQHTWNEATCTEPKTCTECGETEGEPLGHTWVEATCTEPKTCTVCGATEGKANGHTVVEWSIVKEAACDEEGIENGICSVCGETVERSIPKVEHTPGEWKITKEATETAPGEKTQFCAVCGAELQKESFARTPEEIKADYVSKCKTYQYETIARDPDKYLLTNAKYTGEVIQVVEDGNKYQLRVDITKTRYGYTDTIYVTYNRKEGEARILEKDIVNIYGVNMSTVSYKSVLGASITLPYVIATYIDVL